MRSIKRGLVILSLAALAGTAACGDDGGDDGGANIDAGEGDTPDAAPGPADLRDGVFALLDTQVLDLVNVGGQDTELVIAAGPVVSIGFGDKTASGVPAPAFTSGGLLNGCDVTVFQVGTDIERPVVDEGSFTFAGTKLPIQTCSFDDTPGVGQYTCPLQSNMTVPENTTVEANSDGTMLITIPLPDSRFAGLNVTGTQLVVQGFANAKFNGVFGVISHPSDRSIQVFNPEALGETAETVQAGQTVGYSLLTGAGPIAVVSPLATPLPTVEELDFLGGNDPAIDEITVGKAVGDVVPDFADVKLLPSGEGLALASDSARVYEFPTTAADWRFSCAPAQSGSCGAAGGPQAGWVLSGTTTDAPIDTLDPTAMPAPVTSFATFQCRAVGAEDVTLLADGVTAILGTNPTRIETRLSRVTPELGQVAARGVVGHSLVGFTDLVQKSSR